MIEKDKTIPNVLNKYEQEKLLSVFNERYPSSLRNKTMINLMLNSGLRLAETINLKWNDIDFSSAKLTIINEENKKSRDIFLKENSIQQLEKWKKRQNQIFNKKKINNKSDIIFTALSGNKLNKANVRKMIYRYADKAGIQEEVTRNYKDEKGNILDKTYREKKVSPHTLRHTFAVELFKSTNDIKKVQEALDHSSVQSTKVYRHLCEQNKEKL